MGKVLLYMLTGLAILVQYFFYPIHLDISLNNVYLLVVNGLSRTFMVIFAVLDIIYGIVMIIDIKKGLSTDDNNEEETDGVMLLMLVVSFVVLLLSIL